MTSGEGGGGEWRPGWLGGVLREGLGPQSARQTSVERKLITSVVLCSYYFAFPASESSSVWEKAGRGTGDWPLE